MESEPRTTVVGTVIDPVGTSELSGTDPAEGRGVGPGLSSIGPDGVVGSEVSPGAGVGSTGELVVGAGVVVGSGETGVDGSTVTLVPASGDDDSGAGSMGQSIRGRSGAGRNVGVVVGAEDAGSRDVGREESAVVAAGPIGSAE